MSWVCSVWFCFLFSRDARRVARAKETENKEQTSNILITYPVSLSFIFCARRKDVKVKISRSASRSGKRKIGANFAKKLPGKSGWTIVRWGHIVKQDGYYKVHIKMLKNKKKQGCQIDVEKLLQLTEEL